MINRLLRWTLDTIIRYPLLFWSCVVADLLGAVLGGVYWYVPMLWQSPTWALPFIPDCPLAALLGCIALVGVWAHKRWRLFFALTAFACMKYGAWTVAFWLREWVSAGTIAPIEAFLFITHIGLFIQGLLFVPHIGPLPLFKRWVVVGWFVLSVYVDYGVGYHPPLAPHITTAFVRWLATFLTVALGTALLLLPPYQETEQIP